MCAFLKYCMFYNDCKFEPLPLQRRENVEMITNEYQFNNSNYLCDDTILELSNDQTSHGEIINDDVAHKNIGNLIHKFPSTDTRKKDKRNTCSHVR